MYTKTSALALCHVFAQCYPSCLAALLLCSVASLLSAPGPRCGSNYCWNNGTCNDGTCQCRDPYYGSNCYERRCKSSVYAAVVKFTESRSPRTQGVFHVSGNVFACLHATCQCKCLCKLCHEHLRTQFRRLYISILVVLCVHLINNLQCITCKQ